VQHYDTLTTLFTVLSATGAFSRSSNSNTASQPLTPLIQGSTPIPVSHRVRTRGVPLRSDSEPERKRVKTTLGADKAIKLIMSVLKDQQGGGRVRFNTVELAIQLL